jgi:glucose-6-phosphate 1-dehydrogenase
MSNPFRNSSKESINIAPSILIIFGASGDLTHRKLIPALYNLAVDGLLPTHFSTIGVARRDISDEDFRKTLESDIKEFSRRKELNDSVWKEIAEHSFYVQCPFDDLESYKKVKDKIEGIERLSGVRCHKLFYLATAPEYFDIISENLSKTKLLEDSKE